MKKQQSEPWLWWKHGVIYHIYPRSFMDSGGDGIGDLQGIISKLDYLSDLGVDAIWLSPVFLSPMVDFGYDVSDYRKIDPVFGTLEDFKMLICIAHDLGIRVISDMILNHTSDQHLWFKESRSATDNPKRNWYIWKDGNKTYPPNNWKSAVGGSAWQLDKTTGQYYYHSFFKEQPDLNWRNPELAGAFFEELKFWLDLGVDGFRLDVINLIVKDKKFRNNPYLFWNPLFQQHIFTRNRRKSLKIVRELRKLIDQYENRVLVGEIYTLPPGNSQVAGSYLSNGDGIHLAFDFSLIFRSWNAKRYFRCIEEGYRHIPEKGWPSIVLSNHDLFRSIDRFPWRRNKEQKAKVAAALLLTLKGTPFIYYGEEIGMRNSRIKYRDLRDPLGKRFWPFFSGRDKARTPMQWNSSLHGGFTDEKPWLPVNSDTVHRNVEKQEKEQTSLLTFYKTLIKIRKNHPALQQGQWIPMLTGRNGILVYARIVEDEWIVIVLNFTGRKKRMVLQEHCFGSVLYSTHRNVDEIYYFQDLWIFPFEVSIYKS